MKKITLLVVALLTTFAGFAQPVIELMWEQSTKSGATFEVKDVRNGFDYYNGELFLASRRSADTEVVIYDAATGLPKMNGDAIVQLPSSDLNMAWAGGDVAIDINGAIYGIASNNVNVIKWANATATAEMFATFPAIGVWAFDAFVDADGNGCIVGAPQNDKIIYYIPITNNVAGTLVTITTGIASLGATPRPFIVDAKTFWIDGNAIRPTLVTLNDDLTVKSEQVLTSDAILAGANGIAQFDYSGKTYLVAAANNHGASETIPQHSAALFEFDAAAFTVTQVGGYLPAAGLGATTDASHVVKPVVHVADDAAYIYLMGGMDGLACVKLSVPAPVVLTTTLVWEQSTKSGATFEVKDVRNGFDYYNGELFLASRRSADTEVVIYDAATGLPKMNGDAIVQLPSSDLNMAWAGGDVAIDINGAIYGIASNNVNVIKWANATATAEMFATFPAIGVWAFDAFVDADGNGCIVGAPQNDKIIYYIPITNNVAGTLVTITTGIASLGATPRPFIVDAKTFWIDGNAIRPTLVTLNDDLTVKSEQVLTSDAILAGANGIAQFEYSGKTYLVAAANNHGASETIPQHSAALFEFDAAAFTVTQVGGYLPAAGLGATTDASHVVKPVVHVADDAAYIYLMGGMDGLACVKLHPATAAADPEFEYALTSLTKMLGEEEFVNPLTSNTDGAITFESSEPTVATVDADGKVTILAKGTTVITAKAAATDNYNAATASYTLTVQEPNSIDENKVNVDLYSTADGLQFDFDGEASIEIYNLSGVLIDKTVAYGGYNKQLENGMYIVRVNGEVYKVRK